MERWIITVEKVVDWVEQDFALLSDRQAIKGRKLLVEPRLSDLDYGAGNGRGVIVAQDGNFVVYFDEFNDEFAVGNMNEGRIRLIGLYGDFQYAIQGLIDERKSVL